MPIPILPDLSLISEAECVALVEAGKRFAHSQGCLHGFTGMIGDIDGGVPEGHDEMPMNLSSVPSFAMTWWLSASSNVLRNATTALGVVLTNLGEVSHIDEHDGQFALISPETQGIARVFDAIEQRW